MVSAMLILTEADTVRALDHDPKLQSIVRELEAGFIDYYEGRLVVPPGERIRLTTRALTMALRARSLRRRMAANSQWRFTPEAAMTSSTRSRSGPTQSNMVLLSMKFLTRRSRR